MNRFIRNLLILMRVANLPTVWSNVTVGWTFGICLLAFDLRDSRQLLELIFSVRLALLLSGVSCIYAAGMILNDVFDWGWDRERRPERPLASGQVSLSTAKTIASCLLGAGTFLIIFSSDVIARLNVAGLVAILVAAIFIYNRWHKGVLWAPYVMGLCRFMLPLIGFFASGAAAFASPSTFLILFTHAGSLLLLTVSITLLARDETRPGGVTSSKDALLLMVPAALLILLPWNVVIAVSALGYWFWILGSNRRHPLPSGVGGRVEDRLAAFPFIDALAVGLFFGFLPLMAVITVHAFILSCFVLILIGRRFIPVT